MARRRGRGGGGGLGETVYSVRFETDDGSLRGLADVLSDMDRRTSAAFDNVGRSASNFGNVAQRTNSAANNLRFGMQNLAFQVQDVIVQLEAGVNPLRVFVQQATQVFGGFGATSTIIGAVVAALAIWISYVNKGSSAASDMAKELDTLNKVLDTFGKNVRESQADLRDTIDDFNKLDTEARSFVLDKAANEFDLLSEKVRNAQEENDDLVEQLTRIGERGGRFTTIQGEINDLVIGLSIGTVRVDEFRASMEQLSQLTGQSIFSDLADDIIATTLGTKALRLELAEAGTTLEALRAAFDIPTVEEISAPDEAEFKRTADAVKETIESLEVYRLKTDAIGDAEKRLVELRTTGTLLLQDELALVSAIAEARDRQAIIATFIPQDVAEKFEETSESVRQILADLDKIGNKPALRENSTILKAEEELLEKRREGLLILEDEHAIVQAIAAARRRDLEDQADSLRGRISPRDATEDRRLENEKALNELRKQGIFNAKEHARLIAANNFNNDSALITQKELASASVDFVSTLAQAVVTTDNLGKAAAAAALEFGLLLAKIALLRSAESGELQGFLSTLFGAGAAAAGGGGGGGSATQLTTALGNAFNNGKIVSSFQAGGIVNRRTVVPMAEMGEAGPEAILPLRRGPSGRLGVHASGLGGGGTTNVYNIDARGSEPGTTAAAMNAAVAAAQNAMIRTFAHSTNARRAARITRAPF